MSYRIVAVHLDNGPHCAARIAVAADLAARFESRLVGIAATGFPDVVVGVETAVPDALEFVALTAEGLRTKAEVAAASFELAAAAAGVKSVEARVVVAEPLDAVVRHARCSDLMVVGQCDQSASIPGVAFDFPQQVLLNAGAPVLVVANAARPAASLGRCIVVAWNDRREAARALRDALPLLRAADRVVLSTVLEYDDGKAAAEAALTGVVPWLAAHGVAVETRVEETGDVGDRILRRVAMIGADLVVSGGYGHSRLREWVLGGATRSLLEQATLPVLFSH